LKPDIYEAAGKTTFAPSFSSCGQKVLTKTLCFDMITKKRLALSYPELGIMEEAVAHVSEDLTIIRMVEVACLQLCNEVIKDPRALSGIAGGKAFRELASIH
jgi:hypothetical protein